MKPWVGSDYQRIRILVVCESHYMPEGSTINLDVKRWYSAKREIFQSANGTTSTP